MIRTLTPMAVLALTLFAAAPGAVAADRFTSVDQQEMAIPDSLKKEISHAAKEIATITPQLKKVVAAGIKKDKSNTMNQAERQEVNREMDDLSKAATALEGRIAGNQPSIKEATKVVTQAKEIGEMLVARKLSGGEPWAAITAQVQVLTKAYKL